MMKRILSTIIIMILISGIGPISVFAINSEPSTLTVIMECGGEPLEGIDVAICRVADAEEKGGSIIYKPTAEFVPAGATFTDLTKEKNIALAASLDTYAHANNIDRISGITKSSGRVTFTGLSAGLYMVTQVNAESSEYNIAPYIVAVPVINEKTNKWEYNVMAYPKTEPVKRDNELISVSVYKVWSGTTNLPESISVQLYKDGAPYGDKVTFGAINYWIYTWKDLAPDHTWTVDEIDAPEGFSKIISGNASTGFVITNTKDNVPEPDDSSRPKMGDDINLQLWITLSAFGVIGLLAMFLANYHVLRRRKER